MLRSEDPQPLLGYDELGGIRAACEHPRQDRNPVMTKCSRQLCGFVSDAGRRFRWWCYAAVATISFVMVVGAEVFAAEVLESSVRDGVHGEAAPVL